MTHYYYHCSHYPQNHSWLCCGTHQLLSSPQPLPNRLAVTSNSTTIVALPLPTLQALRCNQLLYPRTSANQPQHHFTCCKYNYLTASPNTVPHRLTMHWINGYSHLSPLTEQPLQRTTACSYLYQPQYPHTTSLTIISLPPRSPACLIYS